MEIFAKIKEKYDKFCILIDLQVCRLIFEMQTFTSFAGSGKRIKSLDEMYEFIILSASLSGENMKLLRMQQK